MTRNEAAVISIVTTLLRRDENTITTDDILNLVDAMQPAVYGPETYTIANIMELIRNNRKIDAIKAWRASTGFGLKEAKDVVEFIAERNYSTC